MIVFVCKNCASHPYHTVKLSRRNIYFLVFTEGTVWVFPFILFWNMFGPPLSLFVCNSHFIQGCNVGLHYRFLFDNFLFIYIYFTFIVSQFGMPNFCVFVLQPLLSIGESTEKQALFSETRDVKPFHSAVNQFACTGIELEDTLCIACAGWLWVPNWVGGVAGAWRDSSIPPWVTLQPIMHHPIHFSLP